MIVRFFNSGTSNGEAPINYLLGANNHKGDPRIEPPKVIEGIPQLTVDIINSIHRKHKYSSGCIAFRPEEQPTRQQIHQIIDRFKSVVAPNLSADSINSLFVLHKDKPDPKTGLAGFHIHFILPMVQLNGTNAGRRWNPHPPGKESIEIMSLFTSTTNHQFGWQQVQPNPLRVNVASFWKKVEGKTITKKADLLQQELKIGVASGDIKNREELCDFLSDTLGMEITRKGTDYLSVKFPGAGKAIRLKGPLFEANTNYERLLSANSQQHKTVMLTDLEYQTHSQRLSQLLQKRSNPTYKENNNGRQPTRSTTRETTTGRYKPVRISDPSRYGAETGNPSYPTGAVWANGASRNGEKATHTLSATNTGTGHKDHCKPQGPVQQPGPRGRAIWRTKAPTTPAEIDEQIRQLNIALLDASEFGQREIQDQICQLVGRRGNLPKPL